VCDPESRRPRRPVGGEERPSAPARSRPGGDQGELVKQEGSRTSLGGPKIRRRRRVQRGAFAGDPLRGGMGAGYDPLEADGVTMAGRGIMILGPVIQWRGGVRGGSRRVNQQIAPRCGAGSIPTAPPCASTISFTMVRPKPTPEEGPGRALGRRIEDPPEEFRRDAAAGVLHLEFHGLRIGGSAHGDPASGITEAERIGQQMANTWRMREASARTRADSSGTR